MPKGLAKNVNRERIPPAGRWYRDLERDESFKVVTVDEDDDLIEIQHSDGEIEELESAEWFEMDLERIEEPEDWLREGEDSDDKDDRDDDVDDDDDDDEDDDDDDEDEDDDDR